MSRPGGVPEDERRLYVCHSCEARTGKRHRVLTDGYPAAFLELHKKCLSGWGTRL